MGNSRTSGYAEISTSASESPIQSSQDNLKVQGSEKWLTCPDCELRRHEAGAYRKGHALTSCILFSLLMLLSANIVIVTILYNPTWSFAKSDGKTSRLSSYLLPFQTADITNLECLRRTTSFTPALEAIEYYEVDFDNQFAHRTEYRGPPTEEREQAWLDLWHHEGIMIESWQMPMLNRTSFESYEKVKPEKGDGYVALFEVHHQLHCLNLVRQYTWLLMKSYPEDRIPPDLREGDKANRIHVDHCIETLRLALMCHGDMSPLLVTIDPDEPLGRKADFNTHHMCRNFTKLQEWTKAHGVEDWATEGEPGQDNV